MAPRRAALQSSGNTALWGTRTGSPSRCAAGAPPTKKMPLQRDWLADRSLTSDSDAMDNSGNTDAMGAQSALGPSFRSQNGESFASPERRVAAVPDEADASRLTAMDWSAPAEPEAEPEPHARDSLAGHAHRTPEGSVVQDFHQRAEPSQSPGPSAPAFAEHVVSQQQCNMSSIVSPRGEALPTIFEGEGTGAGAGVGGAAPAAQASVPRLSPSSRTRLFGAPRSFPRAFRSEGGVSSARQVNDSPSPAVVPQQKLSPSQPLSSQLSPSLTALLSVLQSADSDTDRPGSAGPSRHAPAGASASGGGASGGGASGGAPSQGRTPGASMYPYRELELSPSLSALMAILSFETEPDSPPGSEGGSCPRLQTSRTLHPVRSGLEASLRELEMDSSPRRLQRQASLDSGVRFLAGVDHVGSATGGKSREPSPTGSLRASPCQSPNMMSPCTSPVRTRNSSLQSTPSPVLTRRLTGNRVSVTQECWQAGPLRRDVADVCGLRSVTEILEEEGTAAFYRGFKGAEGSPARPDTKRTRR